MYRPKRKETWYRLTPPLSAEGSREVLEEMAKPPENTPERRATQERMRFMREMRRRSGDLEPIGLRPIVSTHRLSDHRAGWTRVGDLRRIRIRLRRHSRSYYRRTPPLSPESSREVLEEMSKPPKDTPERRATEAGGRFMEEVCKRQEDRERNELK